MRRALGAKSSVWMLMGAIVAPRQWPAPRTRVGQRGRGATHKGLFHRQGTVSVPRIFCQQAFSFWPRPRMPCEPRSPGGPMPQALSQRRRFLKKASAGAIGASALAAPMVSNAQTVSMRFQSTWPTKDIFHEYAQDFAKKVNDMAGGRMKIEVLPSGAVVPAFQLLEAVNKGTLDGGHGVVAYHYGKNSALALWGSGPAFGMDPNMVLSWHYYGGGKALLEEIYKSINMDVVSYLYGPMPTQPLGWFKKPISRVEDFKGLKYRTVGLAVDLFTDLGAAVNPLPGGEIVPALDRGLIEAAEFNNASSDRALGFP